MPITEKTKVFFRAGNGALVVSYTFDDVTQKMSKFSANLKSGTAHLILDKGQTLSTPIDSGEKDVSIANLDRSLNKGAGIQIRFGKGR